MKHASSFPLCGCENLLPRSFGPKGCKNFRQQNPALPLPCFVFTLHVLKLLLDTRTSICSFPCASPLMALVPLGEPPALQQLLQNVFIADRQLSTLYRMLGDLIDMTDDFEDLAAPAVLLRLRQTIHAMEHAIYFAKIAKLHQIIRLHRAIRTTWQRWHVAPLVELDVD